VRAGGVVTSVGAESDQGLTGKRVISGTGGSGGYAEYAAVGSTLSTCCGGLLPVALTPTGTRHDRRWIRLCRRSLSLGPEESGRHRKCPARR